MAYADEQSYEEMISALQTFVSEAEEQCGVMESAGSDCVDNTDGDPAAEKSNERCSFVLFCKSVQFLTFLKIRPFLYGTGFFMMLP